MAQPNVNIQLGICRAWTYWETMTTSPSLMLTSNPSLISWCVMESCSAIDSHTYSEGLHACTVISRAHRNGQCCDSLFHRVNIRGINTLLFAG